MATNKLLPGCSEIIFFQHNSKLKPNESPFFIQKCPEKLAPKMNINWRNEDRLEIHKILMVKKQKSKVVKGKKLAQVEVEAPHGRI